MEKEFGGCSPGESRGFRMQPSSPGPFPLHGFERYPHLHTGRSAPGRRPRLYGHRGGCRSAAGGLLSRRRVVRLDRPGRRSEAVVEAVTKDETGPAHSPAREHPQRHPRPAARFYSQCAPEGHEPRSPPGCRFRGGHDRAPRRIRDRSRARIADRSRSGSIPSADPEGRASSPLRRPSLRSCRTRAPEPRSCFYDRAWPPPSRAGPKRSDRPPSGTPVQG